MSDTHHNHHVNYFLIFLALCVCTALSVVFDVAKESINSGVLLLFLVFGVAVAKALFVLVYFMHLKFEGRWKYILLAPTMILAMGLPLALTPDIGLHYYTPDVPQIEEYARQQAHAGGAGHGGDAGNTAGESGEAAGEAHH